MVTPLEKRFPDFTETQRYIYIYIYPYSQNSVFLIEADILPELNLVHIIREIFMRSILIILFCRQPGLSKRHFSSGFPPIWHEFITYCTLASCPAYSLWFDHHDKILIVHSRRRESHRKQMHVVSPYLLEWNHAAITWCVYRCMSVQSLNAG
jgi:hypothetical protein